MTKTRADIIAMAHRSIGVLSVDSVPSADQDAYAGDVLDALFDELKAVHGFTFTWALDATPDEAFLPLSLTLASDIAGHYDVPFQSRSRGIARLRAWALPDDRTDRRDTDSDGTISTAEKQAGLEAAYY